MKFSVPTDDGTELSLECPDTIAARWVNDEVLRGYTYPRIPFIGQVDTVLDVGANAGATTVYFAHHYPSAQIHSFEPGSEILEYLRKNTAHLPNVHVHPFGLHDTDQTAEFFRGQDLTMSSIFARDVNEEHSERVELRAAGPWAREQGITRIDVLKVDVEGCEAQVLTSLQSFLPHVQVLYVEYDSRGARHTIEDLMRPTHELYVAVAFLDQGECVYVQKQYVSDFDAAHAHLRDLWRRRRAKDDAQ